jgi:hypothetical protein
VLANTPLLAAIGGLIGIATFLAAFPLSAAWTRPFLTFLLLFGAVLLWLELLAQWPPELLIYRGPPPRGTSRRLVLFAYVLQLTMVGFVGNVLWRFPQVLVPTVVTGLALGVWQFLLPERVKAQRGVPLLLAILALLVSVAILSQVHPTYESVFAGARLNEP